MSEQTKNNDFLDLPAYQALKKIVSAIDIQEMNKTIAPTIAKELRDCCQTIENQLKVDFDKQKGK